MKVTTRRGSATIAPFTPCCGLLVERDPVSHVATRRACRERGRREGTGGGKAFLYEGASANHRPIACAHFREIGYGGSNPKGSNHARTEAQADGARRFCAAIPANGG